MCYHKVLYMLECGPWSQHVGCQSRNEEPISRPFSYVYLQRLHEGTHTLLHVLQLNEGTPLWF